jgi:hypothetical protein
MEGQFSTKDFNTMVLLRYHGVKFEKVEVDRGIKRIFTADTPALQQLLLDYDNGSVSVNAKEWMRIVDDVKEFVHR